MMAIQLAKEEINHMLHSVKDLRGSILNALDGEIGRCSDFASNREYEVRLYDFYSRPENWSR